MDVAIRTYRPDDVTAVVELWNRCLPLDPITREMFEDRVLLDPNFDAAGCRVASDGERVVGFAHAVVRTSPHPRGFESLLERDRETGWLIALFVHPDCRRRGIGTRLLYEALGFIRSRGRRRVALFNYTPNYLLVGLDETGYPGAREFYVRHGFRIVGESVGMGIDLNGYAVPAEVRALERRLAADGIEAVYFERRHIMPTLGFLSESFPHWVHYFLDKLARGHEPDEIVIVLKGKQVIGYCQHRYYQHVERTGPFGVRQDMRGRGVGTLMLHRLLERMAQKGYKFAWFTSTDPETAKYYARAGYRVIRRHLAMVREL